MAKKKRKQKAIPCFTFNQESLRLAQEALKLAERTLEGLERRPLPPEIVSKRGVFAREVLQNVRGKLEIMRQSVGLMCLTTFDYNECLLLATAMTLYINDLLLFTPVSAQRAKKVKQCQRIEQHMLGEIQKTGIAVEQKSRTQD